ncbi:hypothetical protein JHS3_24110 [Jeongeupia sp. HS-3]|nr:hypothetical protein JHS3_24110 [Jeongeupia sp. HS-3]
MPAARRAELVKKNETSTSLALRKRKKAARKKLKQTIKEQWRYAKANNLRAVAVTLTFADNARFTTTRISAFLNKLRRALKRKGHGLPYVWTLEREGRLHYHLLLWLPRDFKFAPEKLKKWWSWGSTWVGSCRSPSAWGRYIAKFDSTAKLPKGARIHGAGGMDEEGKTAVLRAALPRWLLPLLPVSQRARRCPGGGWVDAETGVIHRSPYKWTPWGPKLISVSQPSFISP